MKQRSFKIAGVVVIALFLASMLFVFAAAGKKVELKEPKSKVKIDWWFQDWSGGVAWQKDWVVKFQSMHPNITVNLIPVPFDDLFAKLIPSIAQKTEPEVLYGYDEWVAGKDVSKLFMPLTPTLMSKEDFKEFVYEAPLKNVTGSDGEIYGYPFVTGANAFGFTYHKDIFRQAGVDASKIKSWDDLKAAAKKLTAYNPDKSIKRSGILFSYTESANAFLDLIQMQGARDKVFNPSAHEWDFNIPEAKKAMETFKWFVDNKAYDPQSGDPFNSFPNKLGAMLLIGPWNVGHSMTSFPELDVGFFLMPPFPTADTKLVVGSVVSYASLFVSKRATGDKKNAALIFVKEMIDNPAVYFDIPFYHTPPYWVGAVCNKKYIAELEKRPADKMNEFSRTALTATKQGLPAVKTLETKISEPILIRQVTFPEMENVFLGKKSVDEALEYLTDYLTKQEKQLAE